MAQILLAEPDRPIRELIAGILTDFGHAVTACEDDTQAAARLAIGPIDVLVTDLVLRDGPGATLSRHCLACGIPTVTLTGHQFHLYQPEQDRPPILAEKPFRLDDLEGVVAAVALATGSARAAA
jgi:DNA-binding NtrC family response regulator